MSPTPAPTSVAGVPVRWFRQQVPLADPWLTWPDSLTRALRQRTGVPVRIRVLAQGTGRLQAQECLDLGAAVGATGHIREVALCQGPDEVVRARSVVLPRDVTLVRLLAGLGSTPLARLLFPARGQARNRARLVANGVRYGLAPAIGTGARRTRWLGAGGQLLVSEVFLPAAPATPPIAPR